MKLYSLNFRIKIILIPIFLVAVVLLFRLYQVQIISNDEYVARGDRQYLRPEGQVFDRGSILFETKDGEEMNAATLNTGFTIAINPSLIEYPEDVYNNLSLILDLDSEDFMSRASKKDDPYEVIAKRVSVEDGEKIDDLNLKGVVVVRERWRSYPGKDLASQVLGFISYKDDELIGQYGLERQYEDVLNKTKNNIYANFFVEMFSNISHTISGDNSQGSIVTTIEPEVQSIVEKELDLLKNRWSSQKVGAIVMNPQNGEIYAMAINPAFDLNHFNQVDNISVFNNDLVEGVYEMGSIVKPLTMAIGLDSGKIHPDDTYDDKGKMTLNGSTFSNYDGRARGVVPMQEILNQSLNTGVAYVVSRVGNDKFGEYMKKLIGHKTEIDLPNEGYPLVDNLDSPRDIEYATASFGQGIAMSPISITRALASLGNGGYLVRPHVVKRIDYDFGVSKNLNHEDDRERIFSEKTSEEISRMLVTVVDDALANGNVALSHYTIAAKTGTAQIVDHNTGKYYDDRYLHTFFGYFPAYDPKFIIFLYNLEPVGVQYASQTLTDPFMNIAKSLISYYEIPPDRNLDSSGDNGDLEE